MSQESVLPTRAVARIKLLHPGGLPIVLLSIGLQLIIGALFGHIYDMRIFMATGYLAGTGQNPYVFQDLSSVFHNATFAQITTFGYPPPWALVLGLIYRLSFALIPNLVLYNLALKLPIILANIGLAYLVANMVINMGGEAAQAHRAWVFMLLNPYLLYASTTWGQIDSVIAFLSLASLALIAGGKVSYSAVLLALALAIKPSVLPLLPMALFYVRSVRQRFCYYVILAFSTIFLCISPFLLFGWDPGVIIRNWNSHYTVGGGLSFMAILEVTRDTILLPANWWFLGWLWLPALGIACAFVRPGSAELRNLVKSSAALIMVFLLTRAWVSEPNILLLLPLVVILAALGELSRFTLAAAWIIPLVFSVLNTSPIQLLFPSMPAMMNQLLALMDGWRSARLIAKVIVIVPWQILGWWIVVRCTRRAPAITATESS
jgi:hypothetical protein